MNLTDTIYAIEAELDIFGDITPTNEVSLDCRVMSRQLVSGNSLSSSVENRYEIKVYIPYEKKEPYASLKNKDYKHFRFEDTVYELVIKATVKDFFGVIHHYELSMRELKDAEE